MVGEMGMSSLGPVHVGDDPAHAQPRDARSHRTRSTAPREATARRACDIVTERRAGIERLVGQLLEQDTLVGPEIAACFEGPEA